LAALNALAAAQEHVGDLDRLRKLVKLTVLVSTTEEFVEHAAVADGASNLFVQLFGAPRRDTSVSCTVYTARRSAHRSSSRLYSRSNHLRLRRQKRPMGKVDMANKNDNLPDAATVMKSKSFSSSNMNKHMKIVVIGGSGLIGTKLVNNLRQHSHEVRLP